MSKFTIDFFEFSFLVEACIPPRPIARSMFFDSVSEKYYHEMTVNERKRLYDWMERCFVDRDLKNEQIKNFRARFNPDNQYIVEAKAPEKAESEIFECYLYNNEYHINLSTSIVKKYIIEVKKLEMV